MKLHRFIGNFDFSQRRFRISEKEIVNQLKNVLRLGSGSEILLGDGKLNEALVKITALKKDSAELEVERVSKNENEPAVHLILYCSILKRENFELVVQKATEIGVKEIVPLIAKRTVKLNFKEDRLLKIIKEAAEQSGRGILPILRKPMNFEKAVEDAGLNDRNIFCHPSGKPIAEIKNLSGKIGVFVGPEGGWDEKEEKSGSNFEMANLGRLILRAETAAIAASYFVINSGR